MDATISIYDQPDETSHFNKGLPGGTKLSLPTNGTKGANAKMA
jgi:hypothetical protein